MERFQNKKYIMKFGSAGVGTGSRVENKLEMTDLSSRKIEQKRVAVVNFKVNERQNNSTGSREQSKKIQIRHR